MGILLVRIAREVFRDPRGKVCGKARRGTAVVAAARHRVDTPFDFSLDVGEACWQDAFRAGFGNLTAVVKSLIMPEFPKQGRN